MADAERAAVACDPFTPADIPAAAAAAAAAVARLRTRVPAVPAHWTDPQAHLAILEELAASGSGWVARRAGTPIGHYIGWCSEGGATASAYAPDPGLAVAPGLPPRIARRVVEELVARAGRTWVQRGVRTHVVSVPIDEALIRDRLAWLGYGIVAIDALRGLDDPALPAVPASIPPGVRVRRAGPHDLPAVLPLDRGLRRHLLDAPTFLVLPRPQDRDALAARLADPDVATFLAEVDGAAVAVLRIAPPADDVAFLVRDPGTASINMAFTRAEHRGGGVARALLGAAEAWARERGCTRLGVDFESANIVAARFWTRWFTPVVASYLRRLHPAAGSEAASPDPEDVAGTRAP